MRNLTKTQKRLAQVAKQQRFSFKDGDKLTTSQFIKKFKSVYPELVGANPMNTKDACKFVRVYTDMNALLEESGIKIKSKDYYSEFHVVAAQDSVTKEVKKMRGKAKAITEASDILAKGFTRNRGQFTLVLPGTPEYDRANKRGTIRF